MFRISWRIKEGEEKIVLNHKIEYKLAEKKDAPKSIIKIQLYLIDGATPNYKFNQNKIYYNGMKNYSKILNIGLGEKRQYIGYILY